LRTVVSWRVLLRLSTLGIFVFALAASTAWAQRDHSSNERDGLVSALLDAEFGRVYADDGAGDGTITNKGELIESGPDVKPDSRVKAIVDLGAEALPLLIKHLDDIRPTRIVFEKKPTPLGHVALDILTHIVKETPTVFVVDCADDGLGACIKPGYYFRPDASFAQMRAVKEKWRKTYQRGQLEFRYPHWWRRRLII